MTGNSERAEMQRLFYERSLYAENISIMEY